MWQMIAKAVLGGIGGGLKASNSNTNISGNFEEKKDASEDLAKSSTGILKKVFDKKKSETDEEGEEKTE